MLFFLLEILWWLQPEATAGGGGAGGAAGGGGASGPGLQGCGAQLGMFAVIILVFYFLLIRPQKKREVERDNMLKALRRGDVVRTTGGIRGEITALDDREVTLLVADKVKINVLRANVAGADAPAQTSSEDQEQGKDKKD